WDNGGGRGDWVQFAISRMLHKVQLSAHDDFRGTGEGHPPPRTSGRPRGGCGKRQNRRQNMSPAGSEKIYSETSTMSSTSTGAPSGSSATPTAERAWAPASPKISPMRLEAPLITAG